MTGQGILLFIIALGVTAFLLSMIRGADRMSRHHR